MLESEPTAARYIGSEYLQKNPTWDIEDSPWKAGKVRDILAANGVRPESIVDVGCGAGNVLVELKRAYPAARLAGFDIAPDAERFWAAPRGEGIELTVGDFTSRPGTPTDVLLALDVLEHVQDPFAFLGRLKGRAAHYVFHFPLDLSAISVLRESPLLNVHDKVGHLHYYTRGLALSVLHDCGYRVIDARYTGAAFTAPQRTVKARLAALPRRLAFALNRDWGARLLGGETLMVLATTNAVE
jgi:SAM-dependent methyltransferase